MSDIMIYYQLVDNGMSPAGACGLMGNMKAESAMRSNNAQDGMTNLSDEDYTAGVDTGAYQNFVKDAVGYGLCQWTYHARKAMLLDFAKRVGASIGDATMQVEFCIKELKDWYPGLWKFLCSTDSTYEAASRVCTEYERPAINNIEERARYAAQFYKEFMSREDDESVDPVPEPEYVEPGFFYAVRLPLLRDGMKGEAVKALQELLIALGYLAVDADGVYGAYTRNAVMGFQADRQLTADGECGGITWSELINNYGG